MDYANRVVHDPDDEEDGEVANLLMRLDDLTQQDELNILLRARTDLVSCFSSSKDEARKQLENVERDHKICMQLQRKMGNRWRFQNTEESASAGEDANNSDTMNSKKATSAEHETADEGVQPRFSTRLRRSAQNK